MRTRYVALSGLCVLSVALLAFRLPRLKPDSVLVARSDVRADEMVVEYRMPRPFEVGLAHGIRKPLVWPGGPGIHVGSWSPLRKEAGEFIPSAYDWARGEHYVQLVFRRGPVLAVAANGRYLEFAAWSAPDARETRWHPPGE